MKIDRAGGKLSTVDIYKAESPWVDFEQLIDGNTTGAVVEEKRFSVEKTAAEAELQKVAVSEAVKDICVDEGLHSLNKISAESEQGREDFSDLEHSAANLKEITDGAAAEITGDMESISVNGLLDSSNSDDSFSSGDKPEAAEEITGDFCDRKISLKDLLSADDCASEPQKLSSISLNFGTSNHKQSFDGRTVDQQDTAKEDYAVASVASDAATLNQTSEIKESPTSGITKCSPGDRSATITVFVNKSESNQSSTPNTSYDDGVDIDDFSPRAGEAGGMDGSDRTTSKDCKQLNCAEKDPAVEGIKLDGATNSVRISAHRNDDGDMILSGPKASSGHILYSGSISHRSDSSTTSTRSFAFPILQTEWNSSPVKMVKAERRRCRKHHGWRTGLLCCRF